jgi:chromate transporter
MLNSNSHGIARAPNAMESSLAPVPPLVVTRSELFLRFMLVGLSGFGGALPFARRMLVMERAWLSEHEFAEVLALSQFLPGPNIVNVTVIVGRRFQGAMGSVAAFSGLMLLPMTILLLLATVYAQFADLPLVHGAFNGVAAAASGLMLAMGVRMGRTVKNSRIGMAIATVAFAAIGLGRLPLVWVLAVLAPISIGIVWFQRK